MSDDDDFYLDYDAVPQAQSLQAEQTEAKKQTTASAPFFPVVDIELQGEKMFPKGTGNAAKPNFDLLHLLYIFKPGTVLNSANEHIKKLPQGPEHDTLVLAYAAVSKHDCKKPFSTQNFRLILKAAALGGVWATENGRWFLKEDLQKLVYLFKKPAQQKKNKATSFIIVEGEELQEGEQQVQVVEKENDQTGYYELFFVNSSCLGKKWSFYAHPVYKNAEKKSTVINIKPLIFFVECIARHFCSRSENLESPTSPKTIFLEMYSPAGETLMRSLYTEKTSETKINKTNFENCWIEFSGMTMHYANECKKNRDWSWDSAATAEFLLKMQLDFTDAKFGDKALFPSFKKPLTKIKNRGLTKAFQLVMLNFIERVLPDNKDAVSQSRLDAVSGTKPLKPKQRQNLKLIQVIKNNVLPQVNMMESFYFEGQEERRRQREQQTPTVMFTCPACKKEIPSDKWNGKCPVCP